jgi:hypothetical protein
MPADPAATPQLSPLRTGRCVHGESTSLVFALSLQFVDFFFNLVEDFFTGFLPPLDCHPSDEQEIKYEE